MGKSTKLLPLFIAFYLPKILVGQEDLNLDLFEVFQLTDINQKVDDIGNFQIKLLVKENYSNLIKESKVIKVNNDKITGGIVISKLNFFTKEFCSDDQRKCFLEYAFEGKTYNHEVVVAKNGSQREFFLVQSAFKMLQFNKKSVIQPIKISDYKIIYITLLRRNKRSNHYLLVEFDFTSSSEKTIAKLSTASTSSINFFKLKGRKILYGGLTSEGKHWYDSIGFRKI